MENWLSSLTRFWLAITLDDLYDGMMDGFKYNIDDFEKDRDKVLPARTQYYLWGEGKEKYHRTQYLYIG